LIALIPTFAVPVDPTVKVPDVNKEDGFVGDDPPEPAPDTVNNPATEVFALFTQETDPVFDGAVLETDILVADEGNGFVERDIPLIVGAPTVVNVPVAAVP
jgi:hypothetical protein